MMEDNWENIFKQNKEFFRDEYPLPAGHRERFMAKLKKYHQEEKKSEFSYWKVAAVLIPLLMLSAYFYLDFYSQNDSGQNVELADYSKNLGEAENYLAFLVKEKSNQLRSLKNNENKELINHSLNELDSLQSNYNQLLADLKESGGNPQVIKSVVLNLQLQVEVLESVLKQLEFKQEIKNNFNENAI